MFKLVLEKADKMDIKLPTSAGSLKKKSEVKSLSRVPLFLTPMDCSAPGSCIHGIFQARVLEWVAISYSRISSWPRYQIRVSHIAGRCFTIWATKRKTSTSALLITPKPLTVWITTNWKILQEMGIPDHVTCLLGNLYAVKKQQLELDMEQQTVPNQKRSMSRLYIVTLFI